MAWVRYALVFLSLIGVFTSGALFFRNPFFRNRTISLFVLLFSLQILDFIYSTSEIVLMYPAFAGLYLFPSGFLYGPLFYFHIRSFEGSANFRRIDLMHFVPSLLMILLIGDILLIDDGILRMETISSQFFTRFLYYNYAIAAHLIVYGIIAFFLIRKLLNQLQSGDKIYLLAMSSIYFMSTLLLSFYVEFASGWRDFAPYYLLVCLYFLVLGMLLYSNPKFLKDLGVKYIGSTLSENEMKEIMIKLEEVVKTDQIFLRNNLTISQIANDLGLASYKISQSLSAYSNTNWNDFLNEFRIGYAEKLLRNSDFQHYKIEAIALESGFNNKMTFYNAFKKRNGVTPTAFREDNGVN